MAFPTPEELIALKTITKHERIKNNSNRLCACILDQLKVDFNGQPSLYINNATTKRIPFEDIEECLETTQAKIGDSWKLSTINDQLMIEPVYTKTGAWSSYDFLEKEM